MRRTEGAETQRPVGGRGEDDERVEVGVLVVEVGVERARRLLRVVLLDLPCSRVRVAHDHVQLVVHPALVRAEHYRVRRLVLELAL